MRIEIQKIIKKSLLPKLITFIFVVLIGIHIMGILFSEKLDSNKKIIKKQDITVKPAPQLFHEKTLITPFFGTYIQNDLKDIGVKQSKLEFIVVGIILADDPKDSKAMIQNSADHVQSFHIGDTLPGGAVIKQITSKGVLIWHQEQLESLKLPQNDLKFDEPPKELTEDSFNAF